MSSNSVAEIIGGADNGGGIPQAEDSRGALAGGSDGTGDLWMSNLDMGNHIFGIVAISKVTWVTFQWFLYFKNGKDITSYYWWTWFSTLLTVYIAWVPVIIGWILLFTNTGFGDAWFFYSSLASVSGPMIGYFAPLVILILAYNERRESGLVFTHEIHFWMGWVFAVMFTLFSIFFEIAFLPGIRVWYDLKQLPPLKSNKVVEEEVIEEDVFDDTDTIIIDEDDEDTTFLLMAF